VQISHASLRVGAALAALVVAVVAPYAVWRLEPAKTLDIVIVDKTAPFRDYRAHAAIPWLLHALKIRNRSGRFLKAARDYVGFDPVSQTGRDLTEADLSSADVLFVTDTYGVYAGDYERAGDQVAVERTPKIYGGVSDAEARLMEAFSARGGMVIGEFNAFAPPTADEARARLEGMFGVHWTGWVARYWPNLLDASQVPSWVGRIYERVHGRPFDLRGGGLVFVRQDDDIVVLRDVEDLREGVISQQRTPGGAVFDLPEKGAFAHWIDVVESTASGVLCEHVVDVTPAGERKLSAHGLPRRFPAVTRRWDAWYFAGDFADTTIDLGNPERAGLLAFRRVLAGWGGSGDEGFFWRWYAPIASRLLLSRAR
jgi:hypothetical protein